MTNGAEKVGGRMRELRQQLPDSRGQNRYVIKTKDSFLNVSLENKPPINKKKCRASVVEYC